MPNDRYVEVTETSWFSRVKSAFGGILFGLLLVPLSLGLLFWNEGRAVTTARALAEGAGLVIDVPADRIDPANEGRLVHVAGPVRANDAPSDPALGITEPGLRLVRTVEMYQWTEESRSETEKQLGGGERTVTVYEYSRDWSATPVDSSAFKEPSGHRNPPMPIEGATFPAASGSLGAFALDADQLASFGSETTLSLGADAADTLRRHLGTDRPVRPVGGGLYVGASPDRPVVGDLRVTAAVVRAQDGSVVAAQRGSGVAPYRTEAGRDLFLTADGVRPASEMFADAVTGNTILTWGLRILGLVLLYAGFRLILGVARVIADVIPLFGSIVGAGTALVALLPTLVLGPLTIAIAWLAYRPLVALVMLAVAAILAVLVVRIGRGRVKAAASAT